MEDKNRTHQKKSTFRLKLLLIIFGLLVGGIFSEIGLRIIDYSYPQFYQNDYYRGFALRPGVEGTYRREGTSYVRINSDGLRDREHAKTKPANTVRIALLGDSFVEAMHVPMEQTFWRLLGPKLEACKAFDGRQVEIINFGVSGYGTTQELITLRQKVWDYSPDIVVLAFTIFNDVYDNFRPLNGTEQVPYFVYQDGHLVYDASFRDSPKYLSRDSKLNRLGRWFHDHLRIVQLVHYVQFVTKLRVTDWRNRRRLATAPQKQSGSADPADLGRDNMIYIEPRDENWKESWRVTEGLVLQIRDEVKQKGAGFFMMIVPTAVQVYPIPVVRENFMRAVGLNTLFYPNNRLKDLAERAKVDFFDPAEPMQAYAVEHKVILNGFNEDIGNGWISDIASIASNHDRFTINAHQARRTLKATMSCMHCGTHPEQRYPNPKRTRRADNKVWERYIARSASG